MRLTRILVSSSALLCQCTAHACTVCDSPTGKQLRAGLFDGHFVHTLLLIAAPIPALAAGVLLLYLALPDLPEEADEPLRSRSERAVSEALA